MPRTALFAGSFDPVTNGHLDVVRSAVRIADRLVLAVGKAIDKVDFVTLLESPSQWKPPLGLYAMQSIGSQFIRKDAFSLAPLLVPGMSEIAGLVADVQG